LIYRLFIVTVEATLITCIFIVSRSSLTLARATGVLASASSTNEDNFGSRASISSAASSSAIPGQFSGRVRGEMI
jgi:hypothetical protein